MQETTYRAHTNIALIKYWGKRNKALFLPVTSSLSLTLEAFYTDTTIRVNEDTHSDIFILDGQIQDANATDTVSRFLRHFRDLSGFTTPVIVDSTNHVPTAAGLASSASAYAALASAANAFFQTDLQPKDLSVIARQGSGSASRSLFGGFALWHKGIGDQSESSYVEQIDPANWDIGMLVVVINSNKKKISSRIAMEQTIQTSPFYPLWPQTVDEDLAMILPAIASQDFATIGEVTEHNAMKMHATILSAKPPMTYFEPNSLMAMDLVRQLRDQGIACYFTMDAGPNVKVLCRLSDAKRIKEAFLCHFDEEQLIITAPGPAPYRIQ